MQPFVGSERVGTEITNHAGIGSRLRTLSPWRHAVQYQPMREEGLSRSRMDLDTLAVGKSLLTRRVINLGYILLAPLFDRDPAKSGGKNFTHYFVRALPDDKGGSTGIEFHHRKTQDKTVMLAQVATPPRAFGQQAVYMGRVAIAAVTRFSHGFSGHRFWISWVTNRNLGTVPGKMCQSKFPADEIDRPAAQGTTVIDSTISIIRQRVYTGEPGALVTQPFFLLWIAQACTRRRQCGIDPAM